MLIQLVLLSVFALLLFKILKQRTAGRIFRLVCALLIAVACAVVVFPSLATQVAALFGVGRGSDLIIYLCLAVGAYLVTSIYIQVRQNEQNTARLVQFLALETHELQQLKAELCGLRES